LSRINTVHKCNGQTDRQWQNWYRTQQAAWRCMKWWESRQLWTLGRLKNGVLMTVTPEDEGRQRKWQRRSARHFGGSQTFPQNSMAGFTLLSFYSRGRCYVVGTSLTFILSFTPHQPLSVFTLTSVGAMSKSPPLAYISRGWSFSLGFAVGHGARFAVAQGHHSGPTMSYLKSPCRTDFLSVVNRDHVSKSLSFWENRVICVRVAGDIRTNRQTDG